MNEPTDILRFQDVSISVDSVHGAGIGNLNLSLMPGHLVVVFAKKRELGTPIFRGTVSTVSGG